MDSTQNSRSLSADYYRRRSHLIRARLTLAALLTGCLVFLVGICLVEGWAVRFLISNVSPLTLFESMSFIALVSLFTWIYCVVLARMALYISYHIEHSRLAQTLVSFPLVVVYLFVFHKLTNYRPVLPLAASKMFAVFLFFGFWQSQLNEARFLMRTNLPPRIFMVSWHAFFVCRWVLAACWLIMALGFVLAIASTHPIIDMTGWEGLVLLGTFYFLFRALAQNPNAHADY